MRHTLALITVTVTLSGCVTATQDALVGTRDCGYIGCATGGVAVYPNEEFSASTLPRRWHGWEWGETASAYPPGTPEYERLQQQRARELRSRGLDPMGRPLWNQ